MSGWCLSALFKGKDRYVLFRLQQLAAGPEDTPSVPALQLTPLEGVCLHCFPLGPGPCPVGLHPHSPGQGPEPRSCLFHGTCICTCARYNRCAGHRLGMTLQPHRHPQPQSWVSTDSLIARTPPCLSFWFLTQLPLNEDITAGDTYR